VSRAATATARPGFLLVLEGIDGAGTTTQATAVSAALAPLGRAVHQTREPSDGPIGKLLRQLLAGQHQPVDATTMGLLFAADRADHIQREVAPALAAGAIVVSDRWYHSSLAYQGTEEERGWIAELNRRAIKPDLTVFLDVEAEVALARRNAAGRSVELYDALTVQERVARGYREVMAQLGERERIVILNGRRAPAALTAEIVAMVTGLLEMR
jgi:dTMP kinase